jgi:hypothetical protein
MPVVTPQWSSTTTPPIVLVTVQPATTSTTTTTTAKTTAYELGIKDSYECKGIMEPITTVEDCKKAAAELQYDFKEAGDYVAAYPKGCYFYAGANLGAQVGVWWNMGEGRTEIDSFPVCARGKYLLLYSSLTFKSISNPTPNHNPPT